MDGVMTPPFQMPNAQAAYGMPPRPQSGSPQWGGAGQSPSAAAAQSASQGMQFGQNATGGARVMQGTRDGFNSWSTPGQGGVTPTSGAEMFARGIGQAQPTSGGNAAGGWQVAQKRPAFSFNNRPRPTPVQSQRPSPGRPMFNRPAVQQPAPQMDPRLQQQGQDRNAQLQRMLAMFRGGV
jgi:hypothetical protein